MKNKPHRRQRNGKVALLSQELRTQVNELLYRGAKGPDVISFLARNGVPGVNLPNLTHWRKGGYQDWLAEQQRLQDLRRDADASFNIARLCRDGSFAEANLALAASNLFSTLRHLKPGGLEEKVAEDPALYFTALREATRMAHTAVAFFKFRRQAAPQGEPPYTNSDAGTAPRGGLTREKIEEYQTKAHLI